MIWPLLGFFALFCGWGGWEGGPLPWIWGFALLVVGTWLRIWSIRYIGGAARTKGKKAKRLIVSGPFAYVRNPIYIANFFVFSGFILLCGLPWFLPLALGFLFIQYSLIVTFEEDLLKEKFGQPYLDYLKEVPRWIPKLRRRSGPSPQSPYPLGRVLRWERGGILNLVLMVGLAILKEITGLHLF